MLNTLGPRSRLLKFPSQAQVEESLSFFDLTARQYEALNICFRTSKIPDSYKESLRTLEEKSIVRMTSSGAWVLTIAGEGIFEAATISIQNAGHFTGQKKYVQKRDITIDIAEVRGVKSKESNARGDRATRPCLLKEIT